jgi:hypothetical protein
VWPQIGATLRPPIAPFTTAPLPQEKIVVPLIFPVLGSVHWNPNGYNADRGLHRHTGIDIVAPKMRPVVAPFAGRLGFKVNTFWIYGDNGCKCLGTHLNDDTPGTRDNRADPDVMFTPGLRMGMRVLPGQLIGYVGDSGIATGPHLHFELFAPGDLLRNPAPSLRAAQRIKAPRPNLPVPAARPAPGEVRLVGCARAFDAARGTLVVALAARQFPDGRVRIALGPARVTAPLPASVIAMAGGPERLATLPGDPLLSLYAAARPGPLWVKRLVLHDGPVQ